MPRKSLHEDGGTAFPCGECATPGMTLRDYFAAQAMQALLPATGAFIERVNVSHREAMETIADASYFAADAMLKAREG